MTEDRGKDAETLGRGDEDEEATPDGTATEEPLPPRERPTPLTQQIGRIAVGVVVVLFAIFAVANAQRVSFDWIVGETTATFTDSGEHVRGGVPLILLLVASFVLGAVLGWGATWRRRRHR